MGYLEYLPPGYGDGVPRPLLVFNHGRGEGGQGTAEDLERLLVTGIPQLIAEDDWPAERDFIVLMPHHRDRPTMPCTEPSEIAQFLDFALERYDVDESRVYLTGLSCGAIGSWEYLSQHSDEVVAAAVLIAGDGRHAYAVAGCDLARVPIWAIHGEDDDIVPPRGSIDPINALRRCTDPAPVELRLDVIPDAVHAMWQPIYDGSAGFDIYDWLLSHSKPR
jgi:predicted peptidase